MRNTDPNAATTGPSGRPHGVQAIARAAAVLRALGDRPGGIALGELAATTELPKSTAHRIVAALAAEDLAVQSGGGRVRLGPGIARLSQAARESVAEQLRPLLLGLRRELDETVDLAVLDGTAVRFIDQVPASQRLRTVSAVGEAFPLHCTANGKALLAAMPEPQARALLPARLPRLTAHTIVSRDALMAELDGVRRNGVAFDREEHSEGICAVGAAITAVPGHPSAALSVPVPAPRFYGNEATLATAVRNATAAAGGLLTPI